MTEKQIVNVINNVNVLKEDTRKNVLDFLVYLIENDMLFEECKAYTEANPLWRIKYNDEFICLFSIEDSFDPKTEELTQEKVDISIIWDDFYDLDWFADFQLDENMSETVWKAILNCYNCGEDCSSGTLKKIFGKEFNNVCCRGVMEFINPDVEEWMCLKEMVKLRKNDILKKVIK